VRATVNSITIYNGEVREWRGKGGEMTQTFYAHMNKRKISVMILYAISLFLNHFLDMRKKSPLFHRK
jgi:hypothetical protein